MADPQRNDVPNASSASAPCGSGATPASVGPPEFARSGRTGELTPYLAALLAGRTLSSEQTASAFEAMMTGQSHHAEIGALLALLATRVPTSDEIVGAARIMRKHVDAIQSRVSPDDIVDTAGTGGAPKTFNVSTAAAIVAAAAGAKVAKHGNRSRTGRGSAEVLKQLGVNVDADRSTQAKCLEEAGVCFCFAIHHHPATRHVMPVRQALGFPTIFNLLGPLTNPAGAKRQLMGVYDWKFLQPIAEALRDLGAIRAMVIHSNDGLDEISLSASTNVFHVEGGKVREDVISPKQFGLDIVPRDALVAGDLESAARMIRSVFEGEKGPARDMTMLNAAAAIYVSGTAVSMHDAFERAKTAIDSGAAKKTLDRLSSLSTGK